MKTQKAVLNYIFFGILATALALGASPALAAESADAKIKLEQAKAKFMAKDYPAALQLLDEILADDPSNGEAYHYSGLCQMQLGDARVALPLLIKAGELTPGTGAHEDAAWAALSLSDYEQALSLADRELQADPGNEGAMLIKGQSLIGLGRHREALPLFKELVDSTDSGQAANYYAGISLVYLGRTKESIDYFDRAVAINPDTALGQDAAKYAELLKSGESVAPEPKGSDYYVRLRGLYQYDTNVVPINSDDYLPTDVSNMEDGRLLVDVDGRVDLYKDNNLTLTGRGYLYLSVQQVEHEYDLSYYLLGFNTAYNACPECETGALKAGLGLFYNNAYQSNDFYSDGFRVSPDLSYSISPISNVRLALDYVVENYKEPYEDNFDQDGIRLHYSISQNFILFDGKLNLWYGYRWGTVVAEGKYYDRHDHGGVAGAMAVLPEEVVMTLMATYEDRDYPESFFDRHEKRTTANLSFAVPIYENYDLYVGAVYSNIDANVTIMTYQRWIYTLGIQATLK